MKRVIMFVFGIAAFSLVLTPPISIAGGTQVYRFSDEPFSHYQCYATGDLFPGPAAEFGEDVCVDYQAMNSETVRIKENNDGTTDVGWSLIQQGTATITAQDDNALLYIGPFQVEEIAQDDGNDAGCVWTDGQHAWAGLCSSFFTDLDFLIYQWKITGNRIYFFKATIKGPGEWCYSDTRGGQAGPGCK